MNKSMALVICFTVLLGLFYSLGESCELHEDDFAMEEACTTVACKDLCVKKFQLRTIRAGCTCLATEPHSTCRCVSSCPSDTEAERGKAHICPCPLLSTFVAVILTSLF
ncbi:hypothetical protein NE237_022763 [Protea cynaroides]|uniref:Uncharacterized protein n=1 Tax=Protea cynaroides TaxID=273540 RepID=A0A9Q0K3U6_9MAGN|nr:hypothetical protein NE237_022763 [Protea cynaroides]